MNHPLSITQLPPSYSCIISAETQQQSRTVLPFLKTYYFTPGGNMPNRQDYRAPWGAHFLCSLPLFSLTPPMSPESVFSPNILSESYKS